MASQMNHNSQYGYGIQQQQQPQYQSIRKPSNAIHHAQVASESATFNAKAEHNLSQHLMSSGQPTRSYTVQAPRTFYQEQRSSSMDQGDQRQGSINAISPMSGEDDGQSYEEELQEAQQMMVRARLGEEGMRQIPQERKRTVYGADIQNNAPPAIKSHIAHQKVSSSGGLPSSPRTNLHQRKASETGREPITTLEHRNNSIDQSKESSGFFSSAARKVSLALHGRSQSIDSTSSSQSRNHNDNSSNISPPQATRSGSNAGPKTIKAIFGTKELTIPIVPTTTAMEVLTMASGALGPLLDAQRSVLVESFHEVSSERPLRYFERIVDVVASWDCESDSLNEFHIQSCATQQLSHWEYESLDLYAAPRIIPSDMSTTLYYSHRPESWHKWHFTLSSDGSITMQKYSGGESKPICSLTDCDIYVPSAKKLKKLGAPRKFCFALKSQQKSVLFECSSQFVHFFCTSEQDVAQEWFRALHSWRSHYMVHRLGLKTDAIAPLTPIRPSFSSASQRNHSVPRNMYRKPSDTSSSSSAWVRYGGPNAHGRSGSLDSNYSDPYSHNSVSTSSSRNQSIGYVHSSATERSFTEMATTSPHGTPPRKGSAGNDHTNTYTSTDGTHTWPAQRETKTDFGPFVQAPPHTRADSVSTSSSAPVPASVAQHHNGRNPSIASLQDSNHPASLPPPPAGAMGPVNPHSPSPFVWRFDPFTGEALTEVPQGGAGRKGSQVSVRSGSVASAGGRKGSSSGALRKGSRDDGRKGSVGGGRKGSVAGNGKGRKASAVKLQAVEHLVAW